MGFVSASRVAGDFVPQGQTTTVAQNGTTDMAVPQGEVWKVISMVVSGVATIDYALATLNGTQVRLKTQTAAVNFEFIPSYDLFLDAGDMLSVHESNTGVGTLWVVVQKYLKNKFRDT